MLIPVCYQKCAFSVFLIKIFFFIALKFIQNGANVKKSVFVIIMWIGRLCDELGHNNFLNVHQ